MPRACSFIALLLFLTSSSRVVDLSAIAPIGPASLPSGEAACGPQCRCYDQVLACVGSPSLHLTKIPVVKPPHYIFNILDFRNNRISTIGKSDWISYTWTETLILTNNVLERIDADAFEGLPLLKLLDLSCNIINAIEPRALEPVSFLLHLDLSGNTIAKIQNGTFRTSHELQYLTYVSLAQNPLQEFKDTSLFHLKGLEQLDLGASNIPHTAVEELMTIPPHLEKAVLPLPVTCCLCLAEMDYEKLSGSVEIHCLSTCYEDAMECGPNGNPFEDKAFQHSIREHRSRFTSTLRIDPDLSPRTCEEKESKRVGPPKTDHHKRRHKLGLAARVSIKTISLFAGTLVICGLLYLLRKKFISSDSEEPPEIIRMEEGRREATTDP